MTFMSALKSLHQEYKGLMHPGQFYLNTALNISINIRYIGIFGNVDWQSHRVDGYWAH